ncbi:MAG: cytochrome c peroxidase [Phycisphaerales bacterium]
MAIGSRAILSSSTTMAALVLICTAGRAAAQAVPALQPPQAPVENPITEQKRALGKVLFWDEQLSSSNSVSCGTCHGMGDGGTDGRPPVIDPGSAGTADDAFGSAGVIASDINNNYVQSAVFGTAVQATARFSMPVINAAYATDTFWDGRARTTFIDPQTGQVAIQTGGGLESQVMGPPVSSTEMAHQSRDWSMIVDKLQTARPLDLATNIPADLATFLTGPAGRASYPELFRRAFGSPEITARRIAFAIATYERTLIANQTPWDAFNAGNTAAMTPNQVQGWNNFRSAGPGSAHCNVCHAPPLFSDNTFRNVGVRPVAEDTGRQAVTNNAADRGRFKVPSLRNVGLRNRYMHNGQFTTIPQVLGFYDLAGAPAQFQDNIDPAAANIVVPPPVGGPIDDFISNALTDPRVTSRQFPFDEPTLATQRNADRPTILANTGVAGTGGVLPQVIVEAPGLLHSMTFRIGLAAARPNAAAQLGVSRTAPTNGRITPEVFVGGATTSGAGLATFHDFLSIRDYAPGTILFYQWFIADPSAAGGQALSTIGRVPVFCGSAGCPGRCDTIDFNQDGLFPDTADIDDYLSVFSGGPCLTGICNDVDFNNDGLFPDSDDLDQFLLVFSGGPCI